MINQSVLEASDLQCVRGQRRLFRDLHCRLESGSILQIRGENGSGKTSLLGILCGLRLPECGEVRWNGVPIADDRPEYYRSLAYLGHRDALKGELTPVENLDAAAAVRAHAARPNRSSREALHHLNLGDCLDLPCRMLSAGQRQRVALAGILRSAGGIWILDEPAAALDAAGIRLLEMMIDEQIAVGGMVVFTSHRELALSGRRRQPQQLHLQRFR